MNEEPVTTPAPEAPPEATLSSERRPTRYLHGARPDGSHLWHPIPEPGDDATLERIRERIVPFATDDTVWDITTDTVSPERRKGPSE